MNTRLIAIAGVLALTGAASAFAQEATRDFPDADALSTRDRAEVLAELGAAQRNSLSTSYNEGSPAQAAASTLPRVQVLAELREARRLHLVGSNDGEQQFANAAQQESIRQAGLRAINTNVAQQTR